jgi:hypothetical protein
MGRAYTGPYLTRSGGTRQTISAGCAEAVRLVLDREECLAIIVRDLFSKCWNRIEMLLKDCFFVVSLILDTAPTTELAKPRNRCFCASSISIRHTRNSSPVLTLSNSFTTIGLCEIGQRSRLISSDAITDSNHSLGWKFYPFRLFAFA